MAEQRQNRIVALDALRGLAAAVVVFHHVRHILTNSEPSAILLPLFAGNKAVILFFVLSGYVLSLPYWRGKQLPYPKFLVRRVCRIYLPYLAAFVLALLLAIPLWGAVRPLSPWFYGTWHGQLTGAIIFRQALFINANRLSALFNTAFWSLRYEMEMSIIFPLLCWAIYKAGSWAAVAGAVVMMYLGTGALHIMRYDSEPAHTVLWCSAFIMGAILAREREQLRKAYATLKPVFKWAFLVVVIWAYFRGGYGLDRANIPGACGALVLADFSEASTWLSTALAEYIGKISYSLYLTHGTVLFAVFILGYGRVPTPLLIAAVLLAALLVAHVFYSLVEAPTMALGRRLTQPSLPARADSRV